MQPPALCDLLPPKESIELSAAPSNEGRITESLPWEILELICNRSDGTIQEDEEATREAADRYFASHPVPRPEEEAEFASIDMPSSCHMMAWSEVPLKKYERNKVILSMSQVCRSWRVRMVGLKRIWREIAFDIEFRPTSVHLAAFFLTLIKDHDIPIRIYARFTYGDLSDPTLRCLLSNLREQTHRWETFLYWGRLGPYRSYLDLPAPALQEFSDDHDLSHLYSGQTTQLFAGHAPVLQSLVTSALGGWRSVTLTHLKTLDLWDCNTRLSMVSLLNFLRRTPQLEEINIVSPNPPVHDCTPGEVVSLLRLKDIRVQNPDFYSIVGHLAIPNVRAVAVYSIYTRGASGLQVGPAFQSPHPFVGFASIEAPLLGQAIIVTSFDVRAGSSNFTLAVSFVTEKKTSVCVSLEWAGVYIDGWMEYIKRSITTLARMGFRSGATLHVRTEGCTIDYSPLLRLGAFEYFSVDCQDLSKLLKALSYCQAPLLPNLKSLFALEGDLDNETINSLLKFLQSRRNLAVVFDSDAYMDLVRTLGDCCIIGKRTAQVPNLDQTPWPCAYVRLKDSQLIRQDSPLVLNP